MTCRRASSWAEPRKSREWGEFGVFLHQAHNWADWEETKRSYELYARYVIPHFSRDNRPRTHSYDWCAEHRDELGEKRTAAARAMFDKHEAEQRAATPRPPRGGRSVVMLARHSIAAPPSHVKLPFQKYRLMWCLEAQEFDLRIIRAHDGPFREDIFKAAQVFIADRR